MKYFILLFFIYSSAEAMVSVESIEDSVIKEDVLVFSGKVISTNIIRLNKDEFKEILEINPGSFVSKTRQMDPPVYVIRTFRTLEAHFKYFELSQDVEYLFEVQNSNTIQYGIYVSYLDYFRPPIEATDEIIDKLKSAIKEQK